MRNIIIFITTLITLLNCKSEPVNTQTTTTGSMNKPNIVLIVADDLGYGDLGCYGNKQVKTPNLDRMAAEGMRFTDFYANGPMCSPTRAALLTGRFQQRCGVPTVGRRMREDSVLIPQRLRDEAGYATAMFGKWHLSGQRAAQKERKQKMPMAYGFDLFRGFMGGFIDPVAHLDDFGQPDWWLNHKQIEEEGYGAHLLTRHAIDFMRENAGKRPFFVYLSLPDIHFPWITPDDQPYFQKGKRAVNFDEKLNRLGPHEGTPRLQAAVHRMIEETDKVTGWVLKALREINIADNTLVFFTSDNGGIIGYNPRSRGQISDNGPLRGEKKYLYEGGIRVPAIAWHPGTIPGGVLTEVPTQTIDLFPTFLDMAGLQPPAANSPFRLDGITLLPLLRRGIMPEKRPLFWSFGKASAMRKGNWKLLKINSRFELYDLNRDIGENRDVSEGYPELLNQMRLELKRFELTTVMEGEAMPSRNS
jgi:arylsulfatase A